VAVEDEPLVSAMGKLLEQLDIVACSWKNPHDRKFSGLEMASD
jgi:hypothetical protein